MNDLERISLDKIKSQLDTCVFGAFERIKKSDINIDFETFESYFKKLYLEISIQENNQRRIKNVITDVFNVM